MDKITFKHSDREYAVVKPNRKQSELAQITYNRAFKEALQGPKKDGNGCILREQLEDLMVEQGLWDENKKKKEEELKKTMFEGIDILKNKGGVKLSEAKNIAIKIREARYELLDLLSDRSRLDSITAEGVAENKRISFLLSQCLVYNDTGEQVYKDFDEFEKTSESDELVLIASRNFANLIYNLDDNFEKSLDENQFLLKYGFVNEDLHFVNKKGELTDKDGRLVDKDGYYINETGERITKDGKKVEKTEFAGFIDDDTGEVVKVEDKPEKVA